MLGLQDEKKRFKIQFTRKYFWCFDLKENRNLTWKEERSNPGYQRGRFGAAGRRGEQDEPQAHQALPRVLRVPVRASRARREEKHLFPLKGSISLAL